MLYQWLKTKIDINIKTMCRAMHNGGGHLRIPTDIKKKHRK
jgi:hypothetical protein